jgi:hypothetical protein
MVISYSEIKERESRGVDKTIDKEDLVANLILITDRKNIISVHIVRGVMRDRKYINIMKKEL